MKYWKHLIAIITLLSLVLGTGLTPVLAEQEPNIAAEAAVVMELNSGQAVWSKNENATRAPASTTKILTALIALEKGNLQDQVTVSEDAVRVEGTRVYLVAGETQTLENLLYAMLLNSANDAAYAIAEHIGGSIEGFARMMNEKARELGAVNTNFVNPNGLSEENHYTTALDLALIARAAMENPTFREIVATQNRPWTGAEWSSTLVNGNKLLTSYEGAIGVKTGYTREAGWCLVSAAERNGETFLAVVLGSNNNQVWSDSTALLNYGFNNYYTQTLAQVGQVVGQLEIDKQQLDIAVNGDLTFLQSKSNPTYPVQKIHIDPLKAPLEKGSKIGEIKYTVDGKEIGKLDLVAHNSIERHITLWEGWSVLATGIILLLFLIVVLRFIVRKRSRRYSYGSYGRLRRYQSFN
jgi:D-alanyl-D-alanine carboxypeptidase (penicillin-binding protein 5/6)